MQTTTNQIMHRLSCLRLSGMAKSWQAFMEGGQSSKLSLIQGMELLLQGEEDQRKENRYKRLLKAASFRYQASLEEITLSPARGIDADRLARLGTGGYINHGEAILITGKSGCGKSFMASALGHQACKLGYRVAYYNMQKLQKILKIARLDGSILKVFEKIAATDLLILDDFGLTPLDQMQQVDLLEIIEDRHAKKATIIASQLPLTSWYELIGEATIADAILDRIIHTSHRFELKGETLRKKQ